MRFLKAFAVLLFTVLLLQGQGFAQVQTQENKQPEETPKKKYIFTDDLQLERDYRVMSPIVRVKPEIILATQAKWHDLGNGARRKVFFGDRLTVVLLEVNRPADKNEKLVTHYHAHDQITYVIEGRMLVQVGEEKKEAGPGSVYIVPSNIHHGVVNLTDRVVILDTFTPPREDYRPDGPYANRFTENDIISFVYHWFSLFDKNAPVDMFLENLSPERLEMTTPELVMRHREDFKRWYGIIQKNIKTADHKISNVTVTSLKDGRYKVCVDVIYTAEAYDGERLKMNQHMDWILVDTGKDTPVILKYVVKNMDQKKDGHK